MSASIEIKGNLVDVHQRRIYPAIITVMDERISLIQEVDAFKESMPYIMPGFIDAHVHIESSMLIPAEFARLAVVHGTVSTISDPHEIANVCGIPGIDFMIENGKTVPFKFYFGAPSCVPATIFETAGAAIDAAAIEQLMRREEIYYLSEMMNFPGVLHDDAEVLKKIAAAQRYGKPVDGHAPGLRGLDAKKYIDAGISTDHECFTREEAEEKLQYGMNILIREGSAAKNFEALIDLLKYYSGQIMFCSDDKHPDSLVEGHINVLCARARAKGFDLYSVLEAACVNPVKHYKLKTGLLRVNDFADFIMVKDLENFEVLQTYINGKRVAQNGVSLIANEAFSGTPVNRFQCDSKAPEDFLLPQTASGKYPVIEALDGQLITQKLWLEPPVSNGYFTSDTQNDILKIVVVNRYFNAKPAVSLIRNFGLRSGAIASSVAHDSHNIVAVGVDDASICAAVNRIIEMEGGISVVGNSGIQSLELPAGGLMSVSDGYEVANAYAALDAAAKALGSTLSAPFMTLSFMALLVIPHIKLSDLGLFDGDTFRFLTPDATI